MEDDSGARLHRIATYLLWWIMAEHRSSAPRGSHADGHAAAIARQPRYFALGLGEAAGPWTERAV